MDPFWSIVGAPDGTFRPLGAAFRPLAPRPDVLARRISHSRARLRRRSAGDFPTASAASRAGLLRHIFSFGDCHFSGEYEQRSYSQP